MIWQQSLPNPAADQRLGGFSGMELDWPRRRLWLLSDAKRTHSVALHWQGTVRQPVFSVQAPQPLKGQGSQKLDAEALVRAPGSAPERFWMASEARNPSKRPASLLELKLLGSGGFAIQQQWPLPAEWQPQQGRGLRRNKGPEALVALSGLRFLIAAEAPLKQDSARQLRLLLAQQQGQNYAMNQAQQQAGQVGKHLRVEGPRDVRVVAQHGARRALPRSGGRRPRSEEADVAGAPSPTPPRGLRQRPPRRPRPP